MTPRKLPAVGVAALAIAGATLLAGCSSGGGSVEEFCKTFKAIDTVDEENLEAMADWTTELLNNAPSEFKDDLSYMLEASRRLGGVKGGDKAAAEEALADMDMDRLDRIGAELPVRIGEVCQ